MKEIFNNKQKLGKWLRDKRKYLKPKLRIIENKFIDNLFNKLFGNTNFKKLDLYKEALNCIVANLVYYGRKKLPLTNPNHLYFTEYKWATNAIFKNILTTLTNNGYCHHWKGFKHPTNDKFSFSSKYFPTDKLINNFIHIKNKRPDNYILLYKKDANKKRVLKLYIETWFTKKMNRHVNMINDILSNAIIRFKYNISNNNYLYKPSFENQIEFLMDANYISLATDQESINKENIWLDTIYGTRLYCDNTYEFEINKESMYVYRSFTRGLFEFGGRFYTPVFQGIPSNWRNTITINGEETIELDYSAHHIRLLYHEEGLDFNGEPYIYSKNDKENSDKRTVNKYIAMIAINALNKKQAIMAIVNAIEDDYDNGKYRSKIPSIEEIEKLYDEFIIYHEPIDKYISNDAGIKLQRKDSDIMNEILVELSLDKIIALPIHDSIIVQKKHRERLRKEMLKQYYKLINKEAIIP